MGKMSYLGPKNRSMFRRQFVKQSTLTIAGMGLVAAVPIELLAALRKKTAPTERIGIGLIGCKGMGWSNLTAMLKLSEAHCTALCDVDDSVLQQRKNELAKLDMVPALYKDYRKLLEDKSTQVVIIATPDHWHCLQMCDALAAGKHILLEKPASNSVAEAELMVAVAARYPNLMVQVNQWQRSQQHFKDAIAFVQSGKLGTIAQCKTWMYNGHKQLPQAPDGPVPEGVDYTMWLGPAAKRPFNANRFHYNFRWYWDYAGGLMTDWGVHLIDMVIAGMQAQRPISVASMGGHLAYPTDARETPDTQTALFTYKGFQLSWEHTMGRQYGPFGMSHGIAFIGSNGTLLLNRSGWEVRPENEAGNERMTAIGFQKQVDVGLEKHVSNLIEAIQAGNSKLLNCPLPVAAETAIHCHLGNIALRTGQVIGLSNHRGALTTNQKQANKLLKPTYHNGWKWPS
jgi:predicted dehydrogenase